MHLVHTESGGEECKMKPGRESESIHSGLGWRVLGR